jgi:hypothetical protein
MACYDRVSTRRWSAQSRKLRTHRRGLAVLGAVLLVSLHGLEAGGAADELVRELGLVLRVVGVDVAARMSGARVRHEDTV